MVTNRELYEPILSTEEWFVSPILRRMLPKNTMYEDIIEVNLYLASS